MEWPTPRTIWELRGFLGLTGYYKKYVAGYAHIAQDLTDQLIKDKFGWTEDTTIAFNNLKQAMISPPILAMPDFVKEFVLETDASRHRLGVVLMQQNKPIAY
ncbi:putative mitochondrial protein AtMg00860 [Apium graveolens]|uniref:putative mitochondrial protein AtMg00860 n=1 Tax=Apium graveolens TaxID=4045 RepID=UPI003D7B3566